MEKINVAELLKDCPSGMKLDCTMYDNLHFDFVNADYYGTINCYTLIDGVKTSINFTKYGTFNNYPGAKCVIFPKGKTTWEGFVFPCKFKDGDIIYTETISNNKFISIFKKYNNDYILTYIDYSLITNNHYYGNVNYLATINEISYNRLCTEEETQKLFDVIKKNGYHWNTETKTLEKLIEPIFAIGNKIKAKYNNTEIYLIKDVKDDYYVINWGDEIRFCGDEFHLNFKHQDKYELIPNKFDITTLKPFDKVLVRCNSLNKWHIDFFEKYNKNTICPFICIKDTYTQCIPYENNEHLLDTIDNCDEYYKNW